MKYCPACQRQYATTQRFCLDDGRQLALRDPYHLTGKTLADKYHLDELIGIGGMGAVYSARHLTIDRRVAVKILQPNLAVGNQRMLELFEREAKMAGHLAHENIANILDAGRTTDGVAYIAMEWLEGKTLEEELNDRKRFSPEMTGEIVAQVAAALDAAHAQRIVHRDLKPANIMLVKRADWGEDAPPQVKVLDFGIAKVVSDTTGGSVSAPMGTPHYASPEQFRTGGHIDGRSDLYSLGVVIFRMLTGEFPFNSPAIQELIQQQLNEPAPPIRTLRPELPEELEALVSRLLAKDPSTRPQRAREVAELYFQSIGQPMDTNPANSSPRMRSLWSTAQFEEVTRIEVPPTTVATIPRITTLLNSRRWQVVAGSLLLVALLAGTFLYLKHRSHLAAARKQVAFGSFENITSDRELDGLEKMVPQLLAARLGSVRGLELTGSDEMRQSRGGASGRKSDEATQRQAASQTGAGALVLGTIGRNGSRLSLTARIEDVPGGGSFINESVEGARVEEVFDMIDSLATRIARAYGLAIDDTHKTADLTTRSYQALQFFQTGYERSLAHDFDAAIRNLENATKIDPNFALAMLHLGHAQKLAGNRAAAKETFAKAMALRDRTGEYERMLIEAYHHLIVEGDRQKASESFEQLLVRYPRDREALLALTDIYRDLKQYDRSIEYGKRALAIDPHLGEVWNAMGYTYLLKHDHVNAIDSFKRYAEAEPDSPNPYDSLGDTYTEAGLYDEALAAYQRSFEIQPNFYDYSALWKKAEVFFLKGDHAQSVANAEQFLRNTSVAYRRLGEQTLARVALYEGSLSKARASFERARTATKESDSRNLEADTILREANLFAGLGEYDKALKLVSEARAMMPQSRNWVGTLLTVLSMSGKSDKAQQEFAALGLKTPSPLDFELRARDSQQRGEYETAVGLWTNLRTQMPAVSRNLDLARAYLGMGKAAEAEAELREFLKARPVPDLGSTSPINPLYDTRFILAHYEMARASELLNKPDQAAEYYRKFLAFWGKADFKMDEINVARKKVG
jgi:serine/threonine protein kinase/tetratricopeptide (TPR) repeat protein